MSEVAKVETETLVLPWTGEVFDMTKPAQVAGALVAITDVEQHVADLRQLVTSLLCEEGLRQATHTLSYGDVEIALTYGARKVYDVEKLRDLLTQAGCPQERIELLIKTKIEHVVDGNRARWMRDANAEYASAFEAACEEEPLRQRARVKR